MNSRRPHGKPSRADAIKQLRLSQEPGLVRHNKIAWPKTGSGQKQTLRRSSGMSALPLKADIAGRRSDVRFVP
jgi:hypothetical protein